MSDQIALPDGSFLEGPLFGDQMPRLWTCPDRHVTVAEGCATCQSDVHPTGCGEYAAEEILPWAAEYGYELDPWQDWSERNILGLKPNGKWAAQTNKLIVCRQNGKGTILEVRELGGMFCLREEFLIHTAHEFKTSVKHFNRLKATIGQYRALSKQVKRIAGSHGEESIELFPKPTLIMGSRGTMVRRSVGPVLAFLARSRGSGRGFSCDCLVYDEDMILTAEQVGASLPTMSARPNPQTIYAGSSGMEDSEQAGALRLRMTKGDTKMFGAEWSINPHTDACPRDEIHGRKSNGYVVCALHDDRDDPRSVAKSNPALGYRITLEFTMDEEFLNMPAEEFDRERLGVGQWPTEEAPWAVVSEELWAKLVCGDPGGVQAPIVFAADVDEDGKTATIAAAWYHKEQKRFVIEIPRDCSRRGSNWVLPRLQQLYRKWKPLAVGLPKQGPGAALLDDGKKIFGERLVPVGSTEEAAAFAWFMQQCKEEKIWHFGKTTTEGELMWNAMGRAATRVVGDGGKALSRRDSESDITQVTSGEFAAYLLNRKHRDYDPLRSIG